MNYIFHKDMPKSVSPSKVITSREAFHTQKKTCLVHEIDAGITS